MTTKILHVSLEYTYGVGGIKAVLSGLLSSLQDKKLDITIVTPYYDFINTENITVTFITKLHHMYNSKIHTSNLFRVVAPDYQQTYNIEKLVQHYVIAPPPNDQIANIFAVHKQENIYKAFQHSEPQNRIEYFNGAVGSLVKIHSTAIPIFDIVHTHAWHTSLLVCLLKEFNNLAWIQSQPNTVLNPDPKIINTVHMLSNDQGVITDPNDIATTLQSVGLPLKVKFLSEQKTLNQMYLGLQFADQTLLVSHGLLIDIFKGNNYGLGNIFSILNQSQRINIINNGITVKQYDPGLTNNLPSLAINNYPHIWKNKLKIKHFLLNAYPNYNLDLNNLWFLFIGRFALEKGIDMLPPALTIIKKYQGNLIILGRHVGSNLANSTIGIILNQLSAENKVIIIDNEEQQTLFNKYWRAASDFTLIPSHYEACGLVAMEAMINYSIPISSDVQGLPDTVIPFGSDPKIDGNGFMYVHDTNMLTNLQNTIKEAIANYNTWKQQNILNTILVRVQREAQSFDWSAQPTQKYLHLYKKTLATRTTSTPYLNTGTDLIKILHVSLEYREATVGGLGSVTSGLIVAQNKFADGKKLQASIITPYYSFFPKAEFFTKVEHTYLDQTIESSIYLLNTKYSIHYLVAASNDLFVLENPKQIYQKINSLERIKYFNSAAASFVASCENLKFDIIQIHDWPSALTAVMVKEIYSTHNPKIIYTLHINNKDRGSCTNNDLSGIKLPLNQTNYILKHLGIQYSDYLVGVSQSVLNECSDLDCSENNQLGVKALIFSCLHKKYTKKSKGILNGINYDKDCCLEKFQYISSNLAVIKQHLKQQLVIKLTPKLAIWRIDPNLPFVLYIGRFSNEKGIDCFRDIIANFKQKVVFLAFGRGMHPDIVNLVMHVSKQQPNVIISFSDKEQQQYADLIRAAADFVIVPSHNEACGLAAMEGLANGSLCITSGVGGLKEFIRPFSYQTGKIVGNGFLYQDYDKASMLETIQQAIDLWSSYSLPDKHYIHKDIMAQAKKLDWLAKDGAIQQYFDTYQKILYFQSNDNVASLKQKI